MIKQIYTLEGNLATGFFFEPRRKLSFGVLEETPERNIPERPATRGLAQRLWDNLYGANIPGRDSPLKRDVIEFLRQGNSLRKARLTVEQLLGENDESSPRVTRTETKRRRIAIAEPTIEPVKSVRRPTDKVFSPRAFPVEDGVKSNQYKVTARLEKPISPSEAQQRRRREKSSKKALLKTVFGLNSSEHRKDNEKKTTHWVHKFLPFGTLVDEVGTTFKQFVSVS